MRLVAKVLIGVACLMVVVVTMPDHPRPEPEIVHPRGTPQIQWDVLERGIADQGRWYAAQASRPAVVKLPSQRSGTVKSAAKSGSHRGYGSTAECIAAVENGGDYGRSSNPSHFGRYQYDRQTWAAHGGNPDDWGTASAAEQDRVFANGTAQYGYSAWTPYDGC